MRKNPFKGQRKLSINDNSKTIPYIRSNGICWGPNGNLIFFKSNKIDFKTLKAIDKVIKKEADLIDWIKCYSENKSKFSRSDYKLLEEETESLIVEEFKDFLEWKGFNQLDDDFIIKSINRNESMPNILKLNENIELESTRSSFHHQNSYQVSTSNTIKENFKAKSNTPVNKAVVFIYDKVSIKNRIIRHIRINPLSNKPFFANLINVDI